MAQSVILLTHDEDATKMADLVHAEAGNKLQAINKLENYLGALAGGARKATAVVGVGAVKASGTVTLDTVAADNTVVINGITFTAKSSPSGELQFGLGSGDNEAAANLVAKINACTDALVTGMVTAAQTTTGVAEVTTIECVADEAASLDGTHFILSDKAGTVGFWIDVDDAGGTAPAGAAACDRQVEITTVTTGMTAAQVAGVIKTAIDADGEFVATVVDDLITVTDAKVGARANGDAGDSGFTVAVATAGVDPVVTITAVRPGKASNGMTLAATGGITAGAARLASGSDGTEKTHYYGGAV